MKFSVPIIGAFVALLRVVASDAVVGKAEGFAYGVTGGGNAKPDYPANIDELKSMLTDNVARVIVLKSTFDFTESEGTETGKVCLSWGSGSKCQQIIQDDCGRTASSTATWWKAPTQPIDVASNKTILGVGAKALIRGKGLRFRNGATNIIVQNIQVSELNPKYVWGGDAISFDGADLVWVDHVTVSGNHFPLLAFLLTHADSQPWSPTLRLRLQPQQKNHSFQQLHQRKLYLLY